jgi:hypothetical protein
MPESGTLNLTAEDVTEAAWDELIHVMLDDEQARFAGRSCNCVNGSECGCNSCGTTGCGGGNGHLHG